MLDYSYPVSHTEWMGAKPVKVKVNLWVKAANNLMCICNTDPIDVTDIFFTQQTKLYE